MELRTDDFAVVVASHQEPIYRCLKPPYIEVCVDLNSDRPFGFSNYVTSDMSSLQFPEAWSEIAVLLESDRFNRDSKMLGLVHYRRFFSFDLELTGETSSQPRSSRNLYVESQVKELLEVANSVVIPKKWEFDENSFDQFIRWHPTLQELMLVTLQEFDNLLRPIFGGVTTLGLMRERNFLYPFNMFLGPREFHAEWLSILRPLITSIESHALNFPGQLGDRWGGYMAERLFSIYIILCQETNRWSFIEKTIVIFDGRDELIQQRDELIQQRDELIQQRDELIQQRDALQNSTIWKFTKLLRAVINIFKM